MTTGEVTDSVIWRSIYEECWKMWVEGLDKLRKTDSGKDAERAKQQMEDAERFLRMPLKLSKEGSEDRKMYAGRLKTRKKEELTRKFEESVGEEVKTPGKEKGNG